MDNIGRDVERMMYALVIGGVAWAIIAVIRWWSR